MQVYRKAWFNHQHVWYPPPHDQLQGTLGPHWNSYFSFLLDGTMEWRECGQTPTPTIYNYRMHLKVSLFMGVHIQSKYVLYSLSIFRLHCVQWCSYNINSANYMTAIGYKNTFKENVK